MGGLVIGSRDRNVPRGYYFGGLRPGVVGKYYCRVEGLGRRGV